MTYTPFIRYSGLLACAVILMLASGCEALRPKATPQPTFYTLDRAIAKPAVAQRVPAPAPNAQPTLIVNTTVAGPGFDSQRIIYVREAYRLEYFANSEWIDTPARMLPPLIVIAVENGGAFGNVVPAPSAVKGDLRLDTEIVRLQQDFSSKPSHVQFTLRATMVDAASRRVLATREFEQRVAAASEDPYGGVVAANRAVNSVLSDLAQFCGEIAHRWTP